MHESAGPNNGTCIHAYGQNFKLFKGFDYLYIIVVALLHLRRQQHNKAQPNLGWRVTMIVACYRPLTCCVAASFFRYVLGKLLCQSLDTHLYIVNCTTMCNTIQCVEFKK